MTTMTYALPDSMTMLRRQLKHMLRYPSLTLQLLMMPILFLLLFVYVFGGTLGDGIGGPSGGRSAYLDYVAPGILLMTIASAVMGTSISVAMDMTEGIIDRFRTMAIARVSVLTGHVLGSMVQIFICTAAVLGVAIAVGYRPQAGVADWLALIGAFALIAFALTWLTVAAGISAKSVETASNTPMPLVFLPFIGSGFVPTESMPGWMQWFADYQPFTPYIEVTRGLLSGTGVEQSDVVLTFAWSIAIALFGYTAARIKFNRR
ncbi:ABC transporter permease [Glycomyces xiaoerkulensis]|uniref:ABC transporter permease n=1 Tax=Glycomyces xiaoerkulensis TaxID=2038139 RepID=UPI000C262F07|nr:ABC transporter permease [Glycomyces xiaoerkulensis]